MASTRPKLGLTRKIVAYYLCFCLAAVGWLGVGLVITSHELLCDRGANHCLARLGKAASAIEIRLLKRGESDIGPLLRSLRDGCRGVHAAVVGLDGRFLAHTDNERQGQAADEPVGDRTRDGDLTTVRYAAPGERILQEFRTPLSSNKKLQGELRVAIEEPSLAATIQAAAHFIPIAAIAPLTLIALGGVLLSRLTRPVAAVEARLQEIAREPLQAEPDLRPLRARDAATMGWNRVVDQVERVVRQSQHGSSTDVLEDAARQRTDAQFEQILQRLSDGIAVTDAAGRIAFANRAVAALLGQEDAGDSLAGQALEERLLTIAECPPDADLLSSASLRRNAVAEMVQKADDADRILRVARLPLGSDPSQGHVWSLRDVTQQKLAEQTRDRFIDTATHELRTPLANIKAYAETLACAESIDVELQKEFCNIINSEVTRLARFIDDLLSISSMEVGALTIERQKVETERLFAEILSKVEPLMQQKEIAFEAELPPKMPELHLDKDKIIAVVVNVLGNAAKYTPAGGRVSLHVKVEEGRLRAAVQDSGVGIAANELSRVFEKFFRSDDPRVQAEVGSGLGLSLAREVVRMHGGEITVESELNQGSTFTVSLPLT